MSHEIVMLDTLDDLRKDVQAKHETTLKRIAEIEAKLKAVIPKLKGLPTGSGLWWGKYRGETAPRPHRVHVWGDNLGVADPGTGEVRLVSDPDYFTWLHDPLGNAIFCPGPDVTRVPLTGPLVRFCKHGVVIEAPTALRFHWEALRRFACTHYECSEQDLVLSSFLAKRLNVFAVYATPEHAAAWEAELGEG